MVQIYTFMKIYSNYICSTDSLLFNREQKYVFPLSFVKIKYLNILYKNIYKVNKFIKYRKLMSPR